MVDNYTEMHFQHNFISISLPHYLYGWLLRPSIDLVSVHFHLDPITACMAGCLALLSWLSGKIVWRNEVLVPVMLKGHLLPSIELVSVPFHLDYRKTSSISGTKFQNLNISCILMQLSSLNSLKPGDKLIMKMLLEQRRQAMLQLHLSYQQFYCLLRGDLYQRFYSISLPVWLAAQCCSFGCLVRMRSWSESCSRGT